MTSVPKVIDVEVALQEKIPDRYKKIPALILRLIKKVIRQDDMNRLIHDSSHLHGIPLVDWALDQFGVHIVVKGKEWIPKNGQFIFSANHPLGSLDGLAIITVVATIHKSVKFVANDLLRVIKGLEPFFLFIARFGEIEIDEGRVMTFKEKPQMTQGWINGGYFVVQPEFLDLIQSDESILEQDPLEKACQMGELMAFTHHGFWQCLDTKRDLDLLKNLWDRGHAPWVV